MGISDERFKTHFLFPPEDDVWYDRAAVLTGAFDTLVGHINALDTFDEQYHAIKAINRYLGMTGKLLKLVEDAVEWKGHFCYENNAY